MRFFLSSTYEDLIEHRSKAANAIERLGQQGVRMEVFEWRCSEPGRGTPAYAFGITNRVDELLNFVFDVLERVRG